VVIFKYTCEILCNGRTLTDNTKERIVEGEFMCAKGKSRYKILQYFCIFPNIIMRLGTADVD